MQEKIFCLMADNSIEIVKPTKIYKFLCKHDVEYLLIPIGIYSEEYCLVKPDDIPFEIDEMKFEYELCLQAFDDEDAIYEKIYEDSISTRVSKDSISGIYRMIHSIYNINGANSLINAEMSEDFLAFVFEYFKVTVVSGRKVVERDSRDVSIIDACPYSSSHVSMLDSKIPYIIYCIDDAMGRTKNDSIIPSVDLNKNICIDVNRLEWAESSSFKSLIKRLQKAKEDTSNILISLPGLSFNSLTFVTPSDMVLLNKFDRYTMGYIGLMCSKYDFEDSDIMGSESIEDLYDNQLLNSLNEVEYIDSSIGLYELNTVVEVLSHMKYIFNVIQLSNDRMYGLYDRIILYVAFNVCESGYYKRSCIYAITNEDIENNKDFLSDFLRVADECLEGSIKSRKPYKDKDYEGWLLDE